LLNKTINFFQKNLTGLKLLYTYFLLRLKKFFFLSLADKRHEKQCTDNATLIHQGAEPCPQSDANWLVLILLSVYLLVTNILLVNLLIAMFR